MGLPSLLSSLSFLFPFSFPPFPFPLRDSTNAREWRRKASLPGMFPPFASPFFFLSLFCLVSLLKSRGQRRLPACHHDRTQRNFSFLFFHSFFFSFPLFFVRPPNRWRMDGRESVTPSLPPPPFFLFLFSFFCVPLFTSSIGVEDVTEVIRSPLPLPFFFFFFPPPPLFRRLS